MKVLKELLLFPSLRLRFEEVADFALTESFAELLEELADPECPVADVVANYVPDIRWIKQLGDVKPAVDENGDLETRATQTFQDVMAQLKSRHLDKALQEVTKAISEVERRGEDPEELVRRLQDLHRRKRHLMSRPSLGSSSDGGI